ncbi:transcriptional regulator [Mycolicibacterium phlei]|uniref:TetR/AcrR family transcriptional regulator n=1 Tax=Mycobacteroides chelonae TaxID=1774 RepID=UPI0006189D39|nr:TetR/AcrR family transcriptional regulator [Mycobacteroides chelonae]VEG14588.1 transcriptional regulator [Mycolicibacterium phlei]AKC37613.1 TetR family transcriptional regulator [Mycobacteroides chelonae]ANA96683.1 TetR family transcriptional regulator [Mycobacteroides chelonae CCUG 47445]OLT81198.1 TetR family transcriptional regulator [Mycobacteroides chelonae]ORV17229.1 TetR family transcriptional regulator [Mycobacteroides chelonae]
MATTSETYHHGDLPSALLRAAMELLEENGANELSLRAAARRAGVSTAAPYRHFADRTALVSAVAAIGYQQLATQLASASAEPSTLDDFAAVAVAYVQFALDRPGLFRVMFAEPCDPNSPERTAAAAAIGEYLQSIVEKTFPASDPEAAANAMWALVHGLAFLHLDGKFETQPAEAVEQRVRAAVRAALSAADHAR